MNALQIRVSKLRRALGGIGAGELVTRDGVGYRADVDPAQVDALDFAAQVRSARAGAAEAAAGRATSTATCGRTTRRSPCGEATPSATS